MENILLIIILMLCSLVLSIPDFVGEKAKAYLPPFHSGQLLFTGLILLVILGAQALPVSTVEKETYIISYIFFGLGMLFLVGAVAMLFSERVITFYWRLVRRTEKENERTHLIALLFIMSFAFFFVFFLFYPSFSTIG